MNHESEPRPRHGIRAPVAYCGDDIEGGGSLVNISASGALIEPASPPVAPGTRLDLIVPYFPRTHVELRSVEIPVEVVRETDSGFAVLFRDLGTEARRVLLELSQPEVIELVDELW
jgi:hypothetical protein